MKRGFLLKAADKKKGPADNLKQAKPRDKTQAEPPSESRLPYDQEKNKPDYRPNNEHFLSSAKTTLYKTVPHIRDGDGSTEWLIRDSNIEEKVMNTPGYPARTLKPRRPDLYEVRTTPDMGQGVFAKHNIKRGELIFSERPLLAAPSWVTPADTNNLDRYTFDQWKQIMISEEEKSLEVAVQRMNETNRALYMALHNSHTTDGSGPLYGVKRTNGFCVSKLSDTAHSQLQTSVVCNIGSRVNHSCIPNIRHFFNVSSFSVQFNACRDIQAGEQLYIAYCDLTATKAERQTKLAPYGFSCKCLACVNATPASDNLRKTFRDRVGRLDGAKDLPELKADLVSAKLLEAEMLTEGLDMVVEFFTVQCVLHVASGRLGKVADEMKYNQRVREYAKIHVDDWPSVRKCLEY